MTHPDLLMIAVAGETLQQHLHTLALLAQVSCKHLLYL
jgi:hypothetical protein